MTPHESEILHWKRIAAYMASCTAATLESMPKSTSKSERIRHTAMCRKFSQYLQGAPLPMLGFLTKEEEITKSIQRCVNAVQKYGLERK